MDRKGGKANLKFKMLSCEPLHFVMYDSTYAQNSMCFFFFVFQHRIYKAMSSIV